MTHAQIKTSRLLHERKGRKELGLFLVEGEKNVAELFTSDLEIAELFATEVFFAKYGCKGIEASSDQLARAGTLQTNTMALAWVKLPDYKLQAVGGIVIALDGVSDPGNVGTIWRIADWFGCKQVWLSAGCADAFSPKVIGASMGAFVRVRAVQVDLVSAIKAAQAHVFAAQMSGESVFAVDFPKNFVLVMGSESHGISEPVSRLCPQTLTIPRIGQAESLNVGVACGIIMAQACKTVI